MVNIDKMKETFYVSLSVAEVMVLLEDNFKGELIDKYARIVDEREVLSLTFERYSFLCSSRNGVVVIFDNLEGQTKVHFSTIGGQGTFRWDLGAPKRYLKEFINLLDKYKINKN